MGKKIRISATVDESIEKILKDMIKDGTYRNKSHVVETAIKKMMEDKDDKKE